MPEEPPIPATVYLVGAGPGDPGLLTVAGAAALRRADVVVYDYLANPELLQLAPKTARLIYVGKSGGQTGGGHTKTQDQINQILVDQAREFAHEPHITSHEARIIVRLKGGDPYVFGRGGEEAEFLRAHNIPFVEIPGITSGIAAPAYAGIPVTHRDFTSTITLITGHERDDAEKAEPVPPKGVAEEGGEGVSGRVNYEALAKLGGTLVFYMGVKALPSITSRLIAAGMDPDTPAAVIRWGTRTNQETVTGTLATIVDIVAQAGIRAPAITIVGKVVALRDQLNWFEERPLFGQRIIVTRTRRQVSELAGKLTDLGAQVIEAPTIDIQTPTDAEWAAIDRILRQIPSYDWVVFTSANGVRAAWKRFRHLRLDARDFGSAPRSHVAAIGSATAAALEEIGIYPELIPEKFVAEELAAALERLVSNQQLKINNQKFLLLRADIARAVLREELLKKGATVDDLAIYKTVRPTEIPQELTAALAEDSPPQWITFTSASTANNLWDLLTAAQRQVIATMKRASIGPLTTAALKRMGAGEWLPTVEAQTHTIDGLVDAIRRQTEK